MTEDVREERHKKALTPEEHREIEVARARDELDAGLLEVRKWLDQGKIGLAELQHSMVFKTFERFDDEKLFDDVLRDEYHAKLQALFDEIEKADAA